MSNGAGSEAAAVRAHIKEWPAVPAAGIFVMAKAVVSSFVFAVAAILAAAFFAPRSNAGVEAACSPAYGINPCITATASPVAKAF